MLLSVVSSNLTGNLVALSSEYKEDQVAGHCLKVHGREFMYEIAPSHRLKKDVVLFSPHQMTECKLSEGDVITGSLVKRSSLQEIKTIGFEIAVLRKRKCELTEAAISTLILQKLKQFAMSVSQKFILQLEPTDIEVSLTVKAMTDEKQAMMTQGLFVKPSVYVTLTKNASARYITWHPANTMVQTELKQMSQFSKPDWKFESMNVGGLDEAFGTIMRRTFASRLVAPEFCEAMGIQHVKGMLLYGSPGCGKTLIARQIAKLLTENPVKIVNGPEILNKFVGASEESIRKLFEDAEKEQKAKGNRSGLHVIIFDEIDSICGVRTSDTGAGASVHNAIVNQLLSKIDGVDSLNNILVIGMTNRKELLDPALLRPGRLEVHIEIGLPDEPGREQIFRIHTKKMKDGNMLSDSVDLKTLAERTKNYSGAEIEGVVKSAASFVLAETLKVTDKGSVEKSKDEKSQVKVEQKHFLQALSDVRPAFGAQENDLMSCVQGGVLPWKNVTGDLTSKMITWVESKSRSSTMGIVLDGNNFIGCGKTTVSANVGLRLAEGDKFTFIKRLGFDSLAPFADSKRCFEINKVFDDARRCKTALIILDDLDLLVGYNPSGKQFSNTIVQTIIGAMKRLPSIGKDKFGAPNKLVVLATVNDYSILSQIGMNRCFEDVLMLPVANNSKDIGDILAAAGIEDIEYVRKKYNSTFATGVPIRQVLENYHNKI
jgi:vesicle-fusing ATPase